MPLKPNEQETAKKTPSVVDYKARLERKLYLARTTPESLFDVSDCNLQEVPNNIYSLCKVFRKEALYLQDNQLTNLKGGGPLELLNNLKVLDISGNKFSKLPSNINALSLLEVLDVSVNQLKELPVSIGGLEHLVLLNATKNDLNSLPDSLGKCQSLEVLKLSSNRNLKQLPATFGRLRNLELLEIDDTITYPPREVCKKGTEAILKFFSVDENVSTASTSSKVQEPVKGTDTAYESLQEQIKQHEQLKEEKLKERLAFEEQVLNDTQKEIELLQQIKDKKNKLLQEVKNQQKVLDAELAKVQEKKECDRALLIKMCQDEETKSNDIVNKILNSNKQLKLQMSESWEKERKLEEEMLLTRSVNSKALERKQILISMDETMREEIKRKQNLMNGRRLFAARSLASEISLQNEALRSFMTKFDKNHSDLLESIRQDEAFQKSAVASLLEKSDSASWELARQVEIIETKLAELTRLELSKRKLEAHSQLNVLNKNRIALTKVLVSLFDQQMERRKQLIETIRKMETIRESNNSDTYWMEQYEKLLNSKNHQMVKFLEAVDPNLAYELFVNGVFHYLPLLKDVALSEKELQNLNMNTLTKLGIKSPEDRASILRAVESYTAAHSHQKKPTAPPSVEPTAPLMKDIEKPISVTYIVPEECVICLEMKPSVVFVPCGHICCCYKCFMSIALCPLCRKPIDEIHEVTVFI